MLITYHGVKIYCYTRHLWPSTLDLLKASGENLSLRNTYVKIDDYYYIYIYNTANYSKQLMELGNNIIHEPKCCVTQQVDPFKAGLLDKVYIVYQQLCTPG